MQHYLARLGYVGHPAPTRATLVALQLAHLRAIPFENLDIHLQRPIRLNEAALYAKIVRQQRGGFCFELNGLFAALLRAVGFEVILLSARVWGTGGFSPEFDHLALGVMLEGACWIVDVGFGESSLAPLRLTPETEQSDGRGQYRFIASGPEWLLQEKLPAQTEWTAAYVFSLTPRALSDFAPRCDELQTSPASIFTHKRICTRATPEGRISLANERLITTTPTGAHEQWLETPAACLAALQTHFNITLPNWPPIRQPPPPTTAA
jgi:N-hydroxyarylamine O-acetyltransferase